MLARRPDPLFASVVQGSFPELGAAAGPGDYLVALFAAGPAGVVLVAAVVARPFVELCEGVG